MNSPPLTIDELEAPVLVAHGRFDNRVPLAQALQLWSDLQTTSAAGAHCFIYFRDEGHSIRRRGNLSLWYETVLDFLTIHLADAAPSEPAARYETGAPGRRR